MGAPFNLDMSKQARKVPCFLKEQAKSEHPDLLFNSTPVHQTHCQKHLGVCLDMKLSQFTRPFAKNI